mgnify:CR=1 FL=1
MEDFELSKGALFSHEWKWIRALTIMLWQPPIILHWGRPQTIIAMVSSRLQVKMTLRSAARPRRALTGHSAGIFVSLHSLRFHLWFTPSTLPIHLVISYSHTFHLSVTYLVCKMSSNCFTKDWSGRRAFTKHSITSWFSEVLPKCFTFRSLTHFTSMPFLTLNDLFSVTFGSFCMWTALCVSCGWTK